MVKLTLTLEPHIFNAIIDFLDYDSYCNFLKIYPTQYQAEIANNFMKYRAYKNSLCHIISEMFFNKQITSTNVYMNYYAKIFNECTDSHIRTIQRSICHRTKITEAFNYLLYKLNNSNIDEVSERQIKNICNHLARVFNCYSSKNITNINFYLNNKTKLISHSLNSLITLNKDSDEKNNFLKMFKEIG